MNYADICWRGVHASELGVIVTEQVAYKRPALRRETVSVPGRSGTLTIKQETAWECVTYTPGLAIRPGVDREAVYRWLRGSGTVIFGSMPDSAYQAVIADQFEVTEQAPGHAGGYLLLTPTFECQPYRYEVVPAGVLLGKDSVKGYNEHNASAAPLITATVTPGTVLTLRMSGCEPMVIETPTTDGDEMQVILDCDAQTVVTGAGQSLDAAMLGDFAHIAPGRWELAALCENGSVQKLELLPRWRSI